METELEKLREAYDDILRINEILGRAIVSLNKRIEELIEEKGKKNNDANS